MRHSAAFIQLILISLPIFIFFDFMEFLNIKWISTNENQAIDKLLYLFNNIILDSLILFLELITSLTLFSFWWNHNNDRISEKKVEMPPGTIDYTVNRSWILLSLCIFLLPACSWSRPPMDPDEIRYLEVAREMKKLHAHGHACRRGPTPSPTGTFSCQAELSSCRDAFSSRGTEAIFIASSIHPADHQPETIRRSGWADSEKPANCFPRTLY